MRKLCVAALALLAVPTMPTFAVEALMVQCGREYQAAKSAGTLGDMDWNRYRSACAARLKGASAATPAAIPAAAAPTPSASPPSAALAPTATPTAASVAASAAAQPAASSGTAAMHARQKQCGAEWTADKAALISATPGLTWPKFWSQCNTRIKTTGR